VARRLQEAYSKVKELKLSSNSMRSEKKITPAACVIWQAWSWLSDFSANNRTYSFSFFLSGLPNYFFFPGNYPDTTGFPSHLLHAVVHLPVPLPMIKKKNVRP
jgi:hypothetical protein